MAKRRISKGRTPGRCQKTMKNEAMLTRISNWLKRLEIEYEVISEKNMIKTTSNPPLLIFIEENIVRNTLIICGIEKIPEKKRAFFYQRLLELSGKRNLLKASLHKDTLTFDTDILPENLDFDIFRESIFANYTAFSEISKDVLDFYRNNLKDRH